MEKIFLYIYFFLNINLLVKTGNVTEINRIIEILKLEINDFCVWHDSCAEYH